MIETSIASLLCEKIGIDFQISSPRVLARVVRKRMEAADIRDEATYLALVTSSEEELRQLIESLVVPETWFFRDGEPFAYLRKILSKGDRFAGRRPLRILSLPASTGEEPYSIAITLMDAGIKPADFQVDAVDVSRKALDKAIHGIYGPSSFREKNVEFCWKYIERSGAEYRVAPEVRGAVRFLQGNILRWAAVNPQGAYDIIFFRNLLVYLNEEARKQALRAIDRLLGEGGLLFLGFAEPHHIFFPHYIPADHPRSYAACKPRPEQAAHAAPNANQPPFPNQKTAAARRLSRPAPKKADRDRIDARPWPPPRMEASGPAAVQNAGGKAETPERRREPLDRARELADRGMLAEAGEICIECVKTDPACLEAHYLLGVIALAGKNEEQALEHFSKVIYLEPDHVEALVHLSLLMEKMGLEGQAERYRKRLTRLGGGSPLQEEV